MAPKKNSTVPTNILVVGAGSSKSGATTEDTPEQTPAALKPTKKALEGVARKDTARPTKTQRGKAAKTPMSSLPSKKADRPSETSKGTTCWEKTTKQTARRLVGDPKEADPKTDTTPPAFEATFDIGDSPNIGHEVEVEEKGGEEVDPAN